MDLEWRSNSYYNKPLESGTVFNLKDNKLNISIHKFGNNKVIWYLSCTPLNIHCSLNTDNFEKAIEEAKKIIKLKTQEINFYSNFFINGENNVLVRD